MYEITYGKKYEQGLDVSEIAKRIRQEIKEAIAKDELPKGLKVSVTISRFSGGRSLDATIKEVPTGFVVRNPERVKLEADDPNTFYPTCHHPIFTPEATEIEEKIKALIAAYNYDGSEIQADYWNVNFYSNVRWHHKLEELDKARTLAKLAGEPEPEAKLLTAESLVNYLKSRNPGSRVTAGDVAFEFDVSSARAKKLLALLVSERILEEGYSRQYRTPLYRLAKAPVEPKPEPEPVCGEVLAALNLSVEGN